MATTIKINGVDRTVDVDGDTPLLWVLRDVLGMTGTKFGCGMALCGACTVYVDGAATRPCITTVRQHRRLRDHDDRGNWRDPGGRQDPEGLARPRGGAMRLLPVGPDNVRLGLPASNPHPTDADIDDAMSGNICRCGTYVRIREAIKEAAQSSGKRS
jgi:isoquinoline 1-oxidoreductase alpha subunit